MGTTRKQLEELRTEAEGKFRQAEARFRRSESHYREAILLIESLERNLNSDEDSASVVADKYARGRSPMKIKDATAPLRLSGTGREFLIDAIHRTVLARPNETHTPGSVYEYLSAENFRLHPNKKHVLTTIGMSLAKLALRGDIQLIKKGKGNQPGIYQAHGAERIIDSEIPLSEVHERTRSVN